MNIALPFRFTTSVFFMLLFVGCSKEQLLQNKIERLEQKWEKDKNWPHAMKLSAIYKEFRSTFPDSGQENGKYAHSLAKLALEIGKTTLAVETLMHSLSKDDCSEGQMRKNAFLLAKIYRQRLQAVDEAAEIEAMARKGCQKWSFEQGFLEPECQ